MIGYAQSFDLHCISDLLYLFIFIKHVPAMTCLVLLFFCSHLICSYVSYVAVQFESGILDVCLRILDMNPKYLKNPGKDCSGRRNPIYVSRVLSAMVCPFDFSIFFHFERVLFLFVNFHRHVSFAWQVNCNDDKGVLLGKWTGDYEGGVSPMLWRGSVEILRNWDTQACQPVRYGQCWVFAAVACSGKIAQSQAW